MMNADQIVGVIFLGLILLSLVILTLFAIKCDEERYQTKKKLIEELTKYLERKNKDNE